MEDFVKANNNPPETDHPIYRTTSSGYEVDQVYQLLRATSHRFLKKERKDHTLCTTDLSHEAFLRIGDYQKYLADGPERFAAIIANTIRHILVDYARYRNRSKRGGDLVKVQLHENLTDNTASHELILELDEVISKLAKRSERHANIVMFKCFMGLNYEEIASIVGVSIRTVKSDWVFAKSWLKKELEYD